LNKPVKHHWYGETSPWTEQRPEDYTALNGRHTEQAASKVMILDRENSPQWPSDRTVES